jgi:hypothetical protein
MPVLCCRPGLPLCQRPCQHAPPKGAGLVCRGLGPPKVGTPSVVRRLRLSAPAHATGRQNRLQFNFTVYFPAPRDGKRHGIVPFACKNAIRSTLSGWTPQLHVTTAPNHPAPPARTWSKPAVEVEEEGATGTSMAATTERREEMEAACCAHAGEEDPAPPQ